MSQTQAANKKNGLLAACDNLLQKLDAHKSVPDCIAAILLAMCPLVQYYEGPVYNMAITVLVLLVPYLGLRILSKLKGFKISTVSLVLVMVVYQLLRIVNHGTTVTEFGQSGVFIIYLIALAMGCVDVKTLAKTGKWISVTAAACLIVQYVTFYLLGFHLQMVPTSALLPMAEQWALGAKTGLAGITGRMNDFYRPSAFFLEPSHVFLYMFPHLLIVLFSYKGNRRDWLPAIMITLGLVLCTSAMGIAAAAGSWGLFLIIYHEKKKTFSIRNVFRPRSLIILVLFMAFAVALFFTVPSIRRSVTRIFTTKTGSTAISGRIAKALELLKTFTPAQWLLGVSDNTHGITFNIPGLVDVIYRHGLIGMVLSYEFYLKGMIKLKLPYFLVCAAIVVTSLFSAHTHSTVGMLYYIFILVCGYQTAARGKCAAPVEAENA